MRGEFYNAPSKRGRRCGLRLVFALMLAASVLFALVGKSIRQAQIRLSLAENEIATHIKAVGGYSYHDTQDYDLVRESLSSMLGTHLGSPIDIVWFQDPVRDADVAALHRLSGLKTLFLRGPAVTDACIDDLLRIKPLHRLMLQDTSITPAGLGRLARKRSLEELGLYGPSICDDHLKAVSHCSQLTGLQIHDSSVGDEGIAELATLARLRYLLIHQFFQPPIEVSAGVQSLGTLKQLEFLELSHVHLNEEALAAIGRMRSLTGVDLEGTPITERGVRHLMGLTNLEYLFLSGADVGDEVVVSLLQFQRLKGLFITETAITNAGLQRLAGLKNLEELSVSCGNGIDARGVSEIEAALPRCRVSAWQYGLQANRSSQGR